MEAASWSANPIRFLVLDFSMASGTSSFLLVLSIRSAEAALGQASTSVLPRRSYGSSDCSRTKASSSFSVAARANRLLGWHCGAWPYGPVGRATRSRCLRTRTMRSRCVLPFECCDRELMRDERSTARMLSCGACTRRRSMPLTSSAQRDLHSLRKSVRGSPRPLLPSPLTHLSLQMYRKRSSIAISESLCSPLARLISDTPRRRP